MLRVLSGLKWSKPRRVLGIRGGVRPGGVGMNCCPKVAGSDFVVSNESRAAANAAAQERFGGPAYLLAQHDALTPEDGDEEYETKVCRHCGLAGATL